MSAEQLSNPTEASFTSPETAIERPPGELTIHSFEEARNLQRRFGGDFALSAINDSLAVADGAEVYGIKSFLDKVEATPEEIEFAETPESASEFHRQLAEMIAKNLKVAAGPNVPQATREAVARQKQAYLDGLETRIQGGADFYKQVHNGERVKGQHSKKSLRGMSLMRNGDPSTSKDLLYTGDKIPGIRPNIRVQEEAAGQFVHWSTDKYVKGKLDGSLDDKAVTSRIYLNPSPEAAVKVFSSLMIAANEAGLTVSGKVWDRAEESIGVIMSQKAGEKPTVRADGIVLYATEAEADELLSLVEALSKDTPDLFEGRPTPKVPVKVGEGIAVGSEPVTDKGVESLTSHRAKVLEETVRRTKVALRLSPGEKLDISHRAVAGKFFETEWQKAAAENNIDPDNLAFNNDLLKAA